MMALVGGVLVASLLGSAHCVGMCGGFVGFYAREERAGSRAAGLAPHVAYHLGRLVSYGALGLLAGLVGAAAAHTAAVAGMTGGASVLAGLLMVGWGAARLLAAIGVHLPARTRGSGARGGAGVAGRILRGMMARSATERALVLGLVTTLLPCGWLYAFVATAAGTGSPGSGALVMAVFWLGTVPALAALGAAARVALGPLSRRLPAITASLVLVLGLLTLAGRTVPRQPSAPVGVAPAAAIPAPGHDCGH